MPSLVVDHVFTPPAGQPWGRCALCKLSEAAHAHVLDTYNTDGLPYRCPYCVHIGADPCPHGRSGALDMKGEPLDPDPEVGG
jgi:hypothetical protein